MKTVNPIIPLIGLGLIVAAFLAGQWRPDYRAPQQLTLEQILSIRELHLVRHTYSDLFTLHKKNNPDKAIRAIIQVPVTVTAYLNLKDIELLYAGDSLQTIILPRASLHEPVYHVGQLVVRETRSFQLHAGPDLYPEVVEYLGANLASRINIARQMAEASSLTLQAEAEGKEYLESLLRKVGRPDIRVTFNDAERDAQVAAYWQAHQKPVFPPEYSKENVSKASVPSGLPF